MMLQMFNKRYIFWFDFSSTIFFLDGSAKLQVSNGKDLPYGQL